MAIRDLQLKLVQLGRIRLGKKKDSNGQPERLDSYRFTSPARYLIEEAAHLYGGEVKPWDGGVGKQFEVITNAALINIYLPPQTVVDPFLEDWRGGTCMKRCDGERETIKDEPCSCNPDNRTCKVTTHLSVMLADLPGIGVWRLTTHGIWAASELSQMSALIGGIQVPLPGRLMLENRQRKSWDREKQRIVQKDFNVPVVLLDTVTSRHVQIGGDAVSQALRLSAEAQQAAIAPSAPAAIEAAPVTTPPVPPVQPVADIPKGLAAIAKASTDVEMAAIRKRIKETGEPQELVDAWRDRSQALTAQRARQAQEAEAKRAQARIDAKAARDARLDAEERWQEDPGESEGLLDPAINPEALLRPPATVPAQPPVEQPATDTPQERKAAMMSLLGVAGERKMKTAQLEELMREEFGVGLQGASVAQMRALGEKIG